MLSAENAAFVNGLVTVIRWLAYLVGGCLLLWLGFLMLLCVETPPSRWSLGRRESFCFTSLLGW